MANTSQFPLPSDEEMDDFLNSTRQAHKPNELRPSGDSEIEREKAQRAHQQFVNQLFPPVSGLDGPSLITVPCSAIKNKSLYRQ